jgi:hypothetical protein
VAYGRSTRTGAFSLAIGFDHHPLGVHMTVDTPADNASSVGQPFDIAGWRSTDRARRTASTRFVWAFPNAAAGELRRSRRRRSVTRPDVAAIGSSRRQAT